MSATDFAAFETLASAADEDEFRQAMDSAGYYAFYSFVEQFRERLRSYGDDEISAMLDLLAKGRRLFPNPGRFSPSWDSLWDEFEALCAVTNGALQAVPDSGRTGEWQVQLDNPYTSGQVVCYPGMRFREAAYLYAYFHRELKPHEQLKLLQTRVHLTASGDRSASVLPNTSF